MSNATTVKGCTRDRVPFSLFTVSSAVDTGRSTVKQLPDPFLLVSSIVPPSSPTSSLTMESPSPTPSSAIALGNRSKAVKTRACSSALIPVPVSSTESCKVPLSNRMRNVTAPRSVNLMAFDNRLCPIWTIRFLSPMTTLSLGLSIFRKRFLSAASGMKSASSVSMTVCSLNGTGLTSSFPLSSRKNPNKVFSMASMCPATRRIVRLYSFRLDIFFSVASSSA